MLPLEELTKIRGVSIDKDILYIDKTIDIGASLHIEEIKLPLRPLELDPSIAMTISNEKNIFEYARDYVCHNGYHEQEKTILLFIINKLENEFYERITNIGFERMSICIPLPHIDPKTIIYLN